MSFADYSLFAIASPVLQGPGVAAADGVPADGVPADEVPADEVPGCEAVTVTVAVGPVPGAPMLPQAAASRATHATATQAIAWRARRSDDIIAAFLSCLDQLDQLGAVPAIVSTGGHQRLGRARC